MTFGLKAVNLTVDCPGKGTKSWRFAMKKRELHMRDCVSDGNPLFNGSTFAEPLASYLDQNPRKNIAVGQQR